MTYYNYRVYTISSIEFTMNPRNKFLLTSKNKMISYADYYLEQYKVAIEDMEQPLLRCHMKSTGQDVYLVPELCVLTGVTEE